MKKDGKMSRRVFLAAVPAVASVPLLRKAAARPMLSAGPGASSVSTASGSALALDGGKPVRATSLTTECPGAQFYDDKEQIEATQAVESHSLFRWYGPQTPRKVANFEKDFAKVIGVKYVLGVTSGTAALHVALTALGVGPGDEVIMPAWTWYSCYNAILLTGALPVFGEVDESFNLDPKDVEKKITPQTKAIMVVHLYGAPGDMDGIMAVAREHGLKVLEDTAQCAGGQYKGKRLGSIGDIGTFSFQIHKVITAGEGGAVVTNDPQLFERAVRFHDLGLLRPPTKAQLGQVYMAGGFLGTNYRMNEMTGGVMDAQLKKIDTILDAHRQKARAVRERIGKLPGIKLRAIHDGDGEIGIAVAVLLPSKEMRDKFVKAMAAENVPMSAPSAAIVLPVIPYIENKVAPHPAWPTFNTPRGKEIRYGAECCPRTLDIFNRTATLTIGPKYREDDLNDIVAAICKVHDALLT
jgi:8-amino-3,8-dideoxy-alpha-D-manno-octulosonate transaminase